MWRINAFRKGKFFIPALAAAVFFTRHAAGQIDDSLAQALVKKHIEINASKMSMSGFRVQIFFGSNRTKAIEMRSEFMLKYPDVSTFMVYHQPNFKVRCGDFKTRLDALKLLDHIQSDYPAAFVVSDEVKLPEIK